MSDQPVNHRQYYRLAYPAELMPSIHIAGHDYLVPEISEGGIKVRSQPRCDFRAGDEICGEVVFSDGDTEVISGIVLRCERHDFVIAPLEGISFQRVVLEQRKVISQCPAVRP